MTTERPTPLPEFRPATEGEAGATLYNAYLLLTQLCGLYGEAARSSGNPTMRANLDALAEESLADLGGVYQAWYSAAATPVSGAGAAGDLSLAKIVLRTCRRVHVLVRRMNLWVPTSRWLRILHLTERHWCRLVRRLTTDAGLAASLTGASQARASRLVGLTEADRSERLRIDDFFTAPPTRRAG